MRRIEPRPPVSPSMTQLSCPSPCRRDSRRTIGISRWRATVLVTDDITFAGRSISPRRPSFGHLRSQKTPSGRSTTRRLYLGSCRIKSRLVWYLNQEWTSPICKRLWGHRGRRIKPFVRGAGPTVGMSRDLFCTKMIWTSFAAFKDPCPDLYFFLRVLTFSSTLGFRHIHS